ncbi:hypothetical protein BDN70DRAFT_873574 [Pholiota conissans]|uniref:Uncharacterized protein n=1 Tax=Pholiota conissans TaxID=109636 RepID=A0A9P5ZC00_9AGAR|nr:hypothetical protein BDN70DRAFT_873574 [Pholiota conissans]
MNDTTNFMDALAIGRRFSDHLAYLACNPPKADSLLYLLPPCLVLIAIDVAARLSQRPKVLVEIVESTEREEEAKRLIRRVQEALAKFQSLERRLSIESTRSNHLARTIQKQQNFSRHRQRLSAYRASELEKKNKPISRPLQAFCERLLLQNRIWKQQREIQCLRVSLDSMKDSTRSTAFQAFCERLLLSNKIWDQQKKVDHLMGEAERLKHSRELAVTRAAQQMVVDVQKERMIEEFVKDLIAEVEECRRDIVSLRSEHEREIQELVEDWRQECRRLSKEVERLQMSRDAHLFAQDITNAHESELLERLSFSELKAAAYQQQLEFPESTEASAPHHIDEGDTLTESDFDQMSISNMSTSTCVASGGGRSPKGSFGEASPSPSMKKRVPREAARSLPALRLPSRCQSMIILSPSGEASDCKLEVGPYAGFSFNPLFFGSAASSRGGDATETESTASSRRIRTYSLQSNMSSTQSRGTGSLARKTPAGREVPKRAQWRF